MLAAREPDDEVVVVGELAAWDAPNSMPAIRSMPRQFTAMIDAILSEGAAPRALPDAAPNGPVRA